MVLAERIGSFYYGPYHPMKPHRVTMTHHLILSYDLYKHMEVYRPSMATEGNSTSLIAVGCSVAWPLLGCYCWVLAICCCDVGLLTGNSAAVMSVFNRDDEGISLGRICQLYEDGRSLLAHYWLTVHSA